MAERETFSDETQLISASHAGDRDALGTLYDRYIRQVYEFIYYKTQHRETAEDITSMVFLKAVEHIRSLRAEEHAFRPWIFRIARNAVIDHWRTRRQHANIEDIWDVPSDVDVGRDAETRFQLERVQKHLQGLDATQRDVVLLRAWSGLTYQEIAPIVGKTPENCKVIFSRVAARLREQILVAMLLAHALHAYTPWNR